MAAPAAGQTTIELGGVDHEIGCPYHLGRVVVATETRDDPQTGKPRLSTFVDGTGRTQVHRDDEGDPVVAEFPIYSDTELDRVGYDPDCPACQISYREAVLHARQKHDSAVQALHEQVDSDARALADLEKEGATTTFWDNERQELVEGPVPAALIKAQRAVYESRRRALAAELEKGVG